MRKIEIVENWKGQKVPVLHFHQLVVRVKEELDGEIQEFSTRRTFEWDIDKTQSENADWLMDQFGNNSVWNTISVEAVRWFEDHCELPKGDPSWKQINA